MSRTFFSLRRMRRFISRHPAPLTREDARLVSCPGLLLHLSSGIFFSSDDANQFRNRIKPCGCTVSPMGLSGVWQRFATKWAIWRDAPSALLLCIFQRHYLSATYVFVVIGQGHQSMPDSPKRIESIISSGSDSCGDVAHFVANRCHTPSSPWCKS